MHLLFTIIVIFFAGMGAGLGTGFAGMSAAAVISPILITFLGIDPYIAVGIALSSDVLASAVSKLIHTARTRILDIKNGLIMMVTVLLFTVVGSYISSLVPSATMGNFSVFMTFLLGIKFIVRPVMTTKEAMVAYPLRNGHAVCYLRYHHRIYMRLYRCRRRYDDASDPDFCPGIRTQNSRWNKRLYHDLHRIYRSSLSFCYRRPAGSCCLILCIIFTLIWARIAAVLANKATPKTLNRATGVILVVPVSLLWRSHFYRK